MENLRTAAEVFEANNATHYMAFSKLEWKRKIIWRLWKDWIESSTMPRTMPHILRFLYEDLKQVSYHMVTPRMVPEEFAEAMASCRARAKEIAEDGHCVYRTAKIACEEVNENPFLPTMPPNFEPDGDSQVSAMVCFLICFLKGSTGNTS